MRYRTTPTKRRTKLTLPDEVYEQFGYLLEYDLDPRDAYMRLLRDEGWTLQSIADAVGEITRERVRQCIDEMSSEDARKIAIKYLKKDARLIFYVPEVPTHPLSIPKPVVMPEPETLERLKELQPIASKVRGLSPKHRDEADEYVSLIWHAHTVEGVSIYRLAKLLGVTNGALQTRLVRYGYMPTGGESKSYTRIAYRKTR